MPVGKSEMASKDTDFADRHGGTGVGPQMNRREWRNSPGARLTSRLLTVPFLDRWADGDLHSSSLRRPEASPFTGRASGTRARPWCSEGETVGPSARLDWRLSARRRTWGARERMNLRVRQGSGDHEADSNALFGSGSQGGVNSGLR